MSRKHLMINKKGFTLIELIIVIAIISIIASIAVPNYMSYKEDAKVKADQISAQNIAVAVKVELSKGITPENIRNNGYKKIADEYFNGVMPKAQLSGGNFIINIIDNNNIAVSTTRYRLYPQFEKIN
ncbi:prepilin-type N-terminal cleavage/methylation domain-containing protein [Clostridium sp. UBA4548]|uniref:prepilin-type N-terminal cleavage/methylation domain-containing protein n=1 Tax=Clostridium sp. UBA4548 TaxID=1946361 RepID=UPI0025C415AD|nr:prepilin-type N-terminal cleavage/methylation domain-containing protein [Clostridium sp. UBA4548]